MINNLKIYAKYNRGAKILVTDTNHEKFGSTGKIVRHVITDTKKDALVIKEDDCNCEFIIFGDTRFKKLKIGDNENTEQETS